MSTNYFSEPIVSDENFEGQEKRYLYLHTKDLHKTLEEMKHELHFYLRVNPGNKVEKKYHSSTRAFSFESDWCTCDFITYTAFITAPMMHIYDHVYLLDNPDMITVAKAMTFFKQSSYGLTEEQSKQVKFSVEFTDPTMGSIRRYRNKVTFELSQPKRMY